MRIPILILPLALMAGPALAQQQPPQPQAETVQVPPELADPQLAGRLSDMMQALSKALLDLPVGEIEAAAEGRQPTAADRQRTVRDAGRVDDPDFERNLERQIAESRPAIEAGMRALSRALPAMMSGMASAKEEIERAAANMPSPGYPNR